MKNEKMMFRVCLLLFVLSFVTVEVMATVVAINPTDDVSLRYDDAKWGLGGGSGGVLKTGSNYGAIETYLKFDLSSIAAPAGQTVQINSADIQMYAASDSDGYAGSNPFDDVIFAAASNAWDENTLTNANAPARGSALDTWVFAAYSWNWIDGAALESFIQSQANGVDQEVSFIVGPEDIDHEHDGHDYYGTATLPGYITMNIDYSIVPEPATATLLCLGLLGLLRKRKSA